VQVEQPAKSLLAEPHTPLAHDAPAELYLSRYRRHRHALRQQQDRAGAHNGPMRRRQRPIQSLKLLPFLFVQFDPKVGLPHTDHPQQVAANGKVFS
jgi:hypothetical protein